MDFRKKFIVEPHVNFKLGNIDPSYKGTHESHESAAAELALHTASLAQLQNRLYAEGKRSLLIVLQGLDAAGKDGVIRHVISGTNPQGVNVACFKQPTREELAHDFLWRAHNHTPAKGEIMIFNRSYYEDVLIVRVHDIVPKSVWSKRYDRICEFERLLVQAGTHVIKILVRKSSSLDSKCGSMIRIGIGRSVIQIIPNANTGQPISKLSKTPCSRRARRAHPGTLFRQTISGFAI